MNMPIERFWLMASNINRISAEKDMRLLTLHNVAQDQEGAKEYRRRLEVELGQVVRAEPVRDQAGVNRLKRMAAGAL